ncbi:MAG TPA: diguanylate cyclase [Candidatus Tripitaka californicus]|uniref:diguanylate cyclase n=1 Tax=Candidatus Tripitaka californicus TaxID=3367616 RepID=UPI0040266829
MQAEDILAIGETSDGLVEALKGEGYRITLVKTASEALEEAKKRPFNLLLLPFDEQTGRRPGLVEAIRELRPSIPVVFTGTDSKLEEVLALMNGGPTDFLGGDSTPALTNSIIRRNLLVGRSNLPLSEDKPSILLVEDDDTIREGVSVILKEAGLDCQAVSSPTEALQMVRKGTFHIIITDLNLQEMEGTELIAKARELLPDVKAIIMTGAPTVESAVAAVKHSVFDYIVKPFRAEDMLHRVKDAWQKQRQAAMIKELLQDLQVTNAELKKANNRLSMLSVTDGLTSLYNHRFLMECLKNEHKKVLRYKHPISVLFLDIDSFKHINDTYGHSVGDAVLVELAKVVKGQLREVDVVGRYGGEEFCVIMPHTPFSGAKMAGERLVEVVARHNFNSSGKDMNVTVSIGIASTSDTGVNSAGVILENADKALYAAKRRGKNQVCCWEELQGRAL